VTSSGGPHSGTGGASEPDWIDEILQRANDEIDRKPSVAGEMPIVPHPTDAAGTTANLGTASLDSVPPAEPVDSLANIRWVDADDTPASAPVTPPSELAAATPTAPTTPAAVPVQGVPPHTASSDIVSPQGSTTSAVASSGLAPTAATELVPQAVGRSAWDDQLAMDNGEPEGWDKLSWHDLDDKQGASQGRIQESTTFGRLLREWGPVLFAAIAIALFTRLVLVQAYHIPSGSMIPTLEAGDRVVVNRLSYRFGEIERGQVVVFAKPQGTEGENDLIKRVIGLPGETIRFVDDQVYIDGLRVNEADYLAQPDSTRPRLTIPGCGQVNPASDICTIPQGYVFVMGDNRLGSSDSRVFGPIATDTIVGRAFLRVWPLNNLGQL